VLAGYVWLRSKQAEFSGESVSIGEFGSVLLNGENLKKYKENQKGRGLTIYGDTPTS
jgi:antirestriction protein ArdC